MPAPSYLAKNRHGAFIFRIKIPVHLRPLFAGKKVITKSLQTYHRPTALKAARGYAAKVDELFYKLEMKKEYILKQTILKMRRSAARANLSDLDLKLSPEALRLLEKDEKNTSTMELVYYRADKKHLGEKLRRIEKESERVGKQIDHAADLEAIAEVNKAYESAPVVATPTPDTPTLSDAMLMYIASKERDESANKAHPDHAKHKGPADSPYRGYTPTYRLLLAAAGNLKVAELNLEHIDQFKFIVGKMKNSNHRKVKPLLEFDYDTHKFVKPLPEILVELENIDSQKLSAKRIKDYFNEASLLIGWLGMEKQAITVETCTRLQNALGAKKTPKGIDHATETSYKKFNIDQLQKLFTHPKINPNTPHKKSPRAKPLTPADFWIPILALFTGARGRELAQLHTNDIRQEEGVWCISITPSASTDGTDEKEVKTNSSIRDIPIHQKLVEIGLLRFHEEQKTKGEKLLFPQLRETKIGKNNPYKSWGQDFRRDILQKHLEIPAGEGEVFHSFRGTLVTELMRKGVSKTARKQIVGHAKIKESHDRYEDEETLESLQTLINNATFEGLDLSQISWEKYKSVRLIPQTK